MIKKEKSLSEAQTKSLGVSIAKKYLNKGFICLYGDLGSGKTTFSKGIATGLGLDEKQIKSPTYTYVRSYKLKNKTFYHFDFYRIETIDDLMAEEIKEIFEAKNTFIVIEWPERIEAYLPKKRLNIRFKYVSPTERSITIES